MSKYCSHFSNLENQFKSKLDYLGSLKAELAKQSQAASEAQKENATLKVQIEGELELVQTQSNEISARLRQITDKVRNFTAPASDEFILQSFIEKLALDVKRRSAAMATLAKRADECVAFEKLMRKQIA